MVGSSLWKIETRLSLFELKLHETRQAGPGVYLERYKKRENKMKKSRTLWIMRVDQIWEWEGREWDRVDKSPPDPFHAPPSMSVD